MTDKEKAWNWGAYIAYLREWADEHKDAAFYGMSPACFDEWTDNDREADGEMEVDIDIGGME